MRGLHLGLVVGIALNACAPTEEADDLGEVSQDALASPESSRPATEVPSPRANSLSFASDGAERAYGIRIFDERHTHPTVVYSVRLADVLRDEQLRLRGEVTLSRCAPGDISGESGDSAITPCDRNALQRSPYGYTPTFSAAFVIGTSPRDASGRRVSEWQDNSCSASDHHCAIALPEVAVRDLAASRELFVNLIVTADAGSANARTFDVMEVEQRHGGLYVTRVSPGTAVTNDVVTTREVLDREFGLSQNDGPDEDRWHPSYRVRLNGLTGGEIIDVSALTHAVNGSYSCDPLVTTRVLLADDPSATRSDGRHTFAVTTFNGSDCGDHSNDGCRYRKSGAFQLPRSVPSTMYAIVLTGAGRSCAAPGGRDHMHIVAEDGFMAVNVRR